MTQQNEQFLTQQIPPEPPKKRLREKGWFIILLLIIIWPVGMYFMWKYANWSKVVKIIITAIIAIGCIGAVFSNGSDDDNDYTADTDTTEATEVIVEEETTEPTEATEEETTEPTEATEEETTEPTKSQLEEVSDMGQYWFQHIDWDGVFKYKSDVHYIMGYSCQKVKSDELRKYGKYVAMADADLQNGFGAEFSSTIYIFMNKKGIAKHVFYDEADGSSTEIPMDSIPMTDF